MKSRSRMLAVAWGTLLAVVSTAWAQPSPVSSDDARTQRKPLSRTDTSRAELVKAATEFFAEWQRAWIWSERNRLSAERKRGVDVGTETARRRPLVHCHGLVGRLSSPYTSAALPRNYVAISSTSSAFGACPTWPIGKLDASTDEARSIDVGLTPDRRTQLRAARASLIDRFRVASEAVPADLFFVGQHVRFLIDQELPDSALGVARRCASETWWCASLEGYVHYREGRIASAQTAFGRAREAMPQGLRCNWDDLTPFLGPSDSSAFAQAGCEASVVLAERWWWLADPLFVDSINERRVAHDARTVRVALLSSIPTDGRRRWTASYGRDAMERLLLRYGWPSRSVWLGEMEDDSHNSWMRAQGSDPQPPYTTYEYARGRIATDPVISALLDPFLLADSAWQLNAPSPMEGNREWWPQVHIRRDRPLAQIPSGQVALLRRDTLVRLAFATDLNRAAALKAGDAAHLVLISSPAPSSARTLIQRPVAPSRAPLVLTADLDASPTLLALEVQAARDSVGDARTRFGVVPPPALRAMVAGDIALSDPVLLSPSSGDALVSNIDSLLHDRMLGSLTISTSSAPRVDVFWESYGVRAEDSARVSVRVERQERLGGFRRLAIAMRLRDDPNATVTVQWRDTPAVNAPRTAASARYGLRQRIAGVPVHARAITLDLSRLSSGPYTLTLEVARADGEVARSSRRFVLTP